MHLMLILLMILLRAKAHILKSSFSKGDECSSHSLNGIEHNNIYMTIENACLSRMFKYPKYFIETYCEDSDAGYHTYESFIWSYSLIVRGRSMAKSEYMINEDTHIISLFYPNIYHFMNIMYIWNTYNSSYYPHIRNLIVTNFEKRMRSSYENMIYKSLLSLLHSSNTNIIERNDFEKLIRKYNRVCFKRLYIIDRSMYRRDGMFFPSIKEKKRFRDFIYDYLNMEHEDEETKKIKVCLLLRKGENNNRNLAELEKIISLLKDIVPSLYLIEFDTITIKDQIKTINSFNLIITTHGSHKMNIMWILKKKVVIIECLGYHFCLDTTRYTISNGFSSVHIYTRKNEINKSDILRNGWFDKWPLVRQSIYIVHPLVHYRFLECYISFRQLIYQVLYSLKYLSV